MTEWYYGHDGNDLVVVNDQEYFDRLPSPDSLMQWETSGTGGNSGWSNTFDSDKLVNKKPQQRTMFGKAGNKEIRKVDGAQSYNSSNCRPSSEDAYSIRNSAAASVGPDYYNDLIAPDSADDIFLNSLLYDDVVPLQSLYLAGPSNSNSINKVMDFQSKSCETNELVQTHVCKSMSENSSDQSFSPSVKVPETMDLVHSDYEASDTLDVNDMSSLQESVLTNLETVRNQLNDKTRLCLRDSLYRLAKHSEQQTSRNDLVEGFSFDERSLPETSGVCLRSKVMEGAEAGTNCIDRTVASLMFSKANVHDRLPALSPKFAQRDKYFTETGAYDYSEAALTTSDQLAQCEVPVFSQQTQGHSNPNTF